MRKIINILLKMLLAIIAILIIYFVAALSLSAITVERPNPLPTKELTKKIYIHTNGVHLDIAMHKQDVAPELMSGLLLKPNKAYVSFGWGDENFYLNTPTWGDLTVKTAITALFLDSEGLMHVKHFNAPQKDWKTVAVSEAELAKINHYLNVSFAVDENGNKMILAGQGFTLTDDFYKANGRYSLFNTCNTWVNTGFKQSGLKASLWTPFDFGLLNKYE